MTHIYFFNNGSRASVYGIGTYLHQIINCLSGFSDISFNVVQLKSEAKEFTKENKGEYNLFLIPCNYICSNENQERYSRNIWYLLSPYIYLLDDDNLIFHLNYNILNSWINLAKIDYPNCKILLTIHYQDWCFSLNGNTSYFKQLIHTDRSSLNYTEKEIIALFETDSNLYDSVDQVICLSEYTGQLLQTEYGVSSQKLSVIYNGLKDEAVFLSDDEKNSLKKRYYINENDYIVLFVGRLDAIKGVNCLIQSFKKILNKYPNSHLFIIGDGDFSLYLTDCVECWTKITFTGRLDKDTLFKFYQLADVGVMPSFHEQCSFVAMEMMMFNIPLLISTTTGLNEMLYGVDKIEIEEKGSEVSISISKMAQSIISLIERPPVDLYREVYLQKYAEPIFLEKMRRLYTELTN